MLAGVMCKDRKNNLNFQVFRDFFVVFGAFIFGRLRKSRSFRSVGLAICGPGRILLRKICVIQFLLLFLHSFCSDRAYTLEIMEKGTAD